MLRLLLFFLTKAETSLIHFLIEKRVFSNQKTLGVWRFLFSLQRKGKVRTLCMRFENNEATLLFSISFSYLLPFKKCWLLCLLFILINNHFQSNSLSLHLLFHPVTFLHYFVKLFTLLQCLSSYPEITACILNKS